EYPGVDFMLIYNLYHYYYKSEVPIYKTTIQNPKYRKKPEAKGRELEIKN
ncbi:MAG: hypothetical protein ACI8X3_002223, partial [Saprospiraceae bacterium]